MGNLNLLIKMKNSKQVFFSNLTILFCFPGIPNDYVHTFYMYSYVIIQVINIH